MPSLTRKEFLRLAAIGLGALSGGRFLAACDLLSTTPTSTQPATLTPGSSPEPGSLITSTSTSTPESLPTSTITATASPVRRSDLIQYYPARPSRVVHTHHRGVWDGDTLQLEALKQMLDSSITRLTGLSDSLTAWQALFSPDERVAIKVNCLPYGKYWTHVPLVMAVVERLQAVGVPAGQITIYDRSSSDLAAAGFTINRESTGVQCYGTDYQYETGWQIVDASIGLSNILLQCDALINMPILKTHAMDGAGMSFAMKNHYGTFDQPQNFHFDRLLQGLPALNALAPIKDRTRLIIGDALKIVQNNWFAAFESDFISMSFDPVAHDALGLQVLNKVQEQNGLDPAPTRQRASAWLQNAASLGVGTDQISNIEFVEESLS